MTLFSFSSNVLMLSNEPPPGKQSKTIPIPNIWYQMEPGRLLWILLGNAEEGFKEKRSTTRQNPISITNSRRSLPSLLLISQTCS